MDDLHADWVTLKGAPTEGYVIRQSTRDLFRLFLWYVTVTKVSGEKGGQRYLHVRWERCLYASPLCTNKIDVINLTDLGIAEEVVHRTLQDALRKMRELQQELLRRLEYKARHTAQCVLEAQQDLEQMRAHIRLVEGLPLPETVEDLERYDKVPQEQQGVIGSQTYGD